MGGIPIEAWAVQKGFKKTGGDSGSSSNDPGNPTVDFNGEKRTNETHKSTTDPDARFYKKAKGQESKFWYLGWGDVSHLHE